MRGQRLNGCSPSSAVSYETLVERHLDRPASHEVEAPSGNRYQIEVNAVWDGGKQSRDLRVCVLVDDGRWSAFHPLSIDFIIAPDGSFIGE